MFEVIPAIDLIDGRVVRLTQGDYAQVERYDMSPVDTARLFVESGATRIHVVDLDGAKAGDLVNLETILAIRKAVPVTIEVGGGIRTPQTIQTLIDAGIDHVILGSILVQAFENASNIILSFPGKVIAGIDAKNGCVATHGWLEVAEITAISLIHRLAHLPIASVIYTDIAKDGTYAGPNLDQLADVANATSIPVIASGGVGSIADIQLVRELEPLGVSGVIVGKAVLSGRLSARDLFIRPN